MKSRRILITMEVETNATLRDLRDKETWGYVLRAWEGGSIANFDILKIQAKVIKEGKK